MVSRGRTSSPSQAPPGLELRSGDQAAAHRHEREALWPDESNVPAPTVTGGAARCGPFSPR